MVGAELRVEAAPAEDRIGSACVAGGAEPAPYEDRAEREPLLTEGVEVEL